SLGEAEHGRRLHPVEQARIVGMVGDAIRRAAFDAAVHAHHARDQRFGGRARAVHGHHRGEAGAPQTHLRIAAEAAVVPHAATHRRFGQFQQHRRHPADEQG
nr:hypothetical protein [Tanacetum cinerariifolium]